MFKKKPKYSDDPTLLYGRNCDGELMEIKDIYDEIGEVVIHGQITFLETREIRNRKNNHHFSYYRFYRYDQLQGFRKK